MILPDTNQLKCNDVGGVVYYSFPSIDGLGFVKHGFSTRFGGVSHGDFASMNLGFGRGDSDSNVRKNYVLLCDAIGVDAQRLVLSSQEHHTNILVAGEQHRGAGFSHPRQFSDVDGLMTNQRDVVLCTFYADCVPLFFADPVKKVIGMAHSGWRGTAARIGARFVTKMTDEFGCDPKDIVAGIAPSIGPCCFEVDRPVYDVFAAMPEGDGACIEKDGVPDKYMVDLWHINKNILLDAGIDEHNITVTDLCTCCHPDVFWTHRKLGAKRGSLVGIMSL